jgi:hypothetical protein
MEKQEYENLRRACIASYGTLFKDSLVFDYNRVGKADRIRLLEDEVYITETKALRAGLFKNQVDILDAVIAGTYAGNEGKDQSQVILKATEMKQKLLLDDIGINDDVKNALNIVYTNMNKEDFENLNTVEIEEGNGSTELSSDFGLSDDNLSAEEKAKQLLAIKQREEKMAKAKDKEGK